MSGKRFRLFIVAITCFIQLVFFSLVLLYLDQYHIPIYGALHVLAIILVLYVVAYHDEPTYKIFWLLIIITMPVLGSILFCLYGRKRSGKPIIHRMLASGDGLPNLIPRRSIGKIGSGAKKIIRRKDSLSAAETIQDNDQTRGTAFCQDLALTHERLAQTVATIEEQTGYPIRPNIDATYYPVGEQAYEQMLAEMRKAKKYIYCEYFIIMHGIMWDQMEEIMAEKAAQGVTVRVMYDDIGSLGTFKPREVKRLRRRNIHCTRFNPMHAFKGTLNYRDHRKMLIIDGKTAFSGGINLSDEYINQKVRFGHWKDIAFRITGPAVWTYNHMFMQFWNAFAPEDDQLTKEEIADMLPPEAVAKDDESFMISTPDQSDGYIISYYDSPLREACISNDFFIDILFMAKDYIWFYTPYLLLGNDLTEALLKAAHRGVDVRIITPGIPDKKMIFRMTRSYYEQLIEAGVRIFEYTPGFVHAKACVMDDYIATVGTVNLDYRSLFLHYENNSLFIDSKTMVSAVKTDMLDSMSKSKEQQYDDIRRGTLGYLWDAILRVFAPLC